MIPSSPRRTWLFLGATCLLYFGPDLLLPVAWTQAAVYPILSAAYQGLLVLLGFAYAPAICRALVVHEIGAGPPRQAVDRALLGLRGNGRPPPVVLAEHAVPFVLTAGLLPRHCQVFVSSALAGRLSGDGLRFLLARAAAHASLRQRLAAFLPVLAFTVLLPDPKGLAAWLALGGFLALWLPLHWFFELDADRQAARLMGTGAGKGLREVLAANASPLDRLTPRPPLRWRLRAVAERAPSPPG
jgi:Zn-dependent protease with chaperone function